MYEGTVTSGYLIEKTFARMCREHSTGRGRYRPGLLNRGSYWTARTDMPPEQTAKQYRALQRDPLQGWDEILCGSGVEEPTDQELAASLFLDEPTRTGKGDDDFIFALDDARELLSRIEPPVEREIVWARYLDCGDAEEYLRVFHSVFPDEYRYAYYMTEIRAIAD